MRPIEKEIQTQALVPHAELVVGWFEAVPLRAEGLSKA